MAIPMPKVLLALLFFVSSALSASDIPFIVSRKKATSAPDFTGLPELVMFTAHYPSHDAATWSCADHVSVSINIYNQGSS
ncbi:unnamed protein product [Linum trigynum]|uniref:Uncharacterized protein n=1 Tax=Linum trigynum TaxID=586398 RepID=A0AAV2GJ57_9ROSI